MTILSSKPVIALTGLGSFALLAGAWFFQLVIGLHPCSLCLLQRWPHYTIVALSLFGFLLLKKVPFRWFALLILFILLGLMIWSSGLGIYHAGVEWKFWPGPACAASIDTVLPQTPEELLASLAGPPSVSCGDIPWSFLGLSLAGYNALYSVLASLGLMVAFVREIRLLSQNKR